jgi:hypothetical protein
MLKLISTVRPVLLSLCILCLLTCKRNITTSSDNIIDAFPLISTIKETKLTVPPILFNPSNMCIVDSFLVVTQRRQDTIFSIFSLPNCKYLLSFGTKGRGPNEFNLSFENVTLGPVHGRSSSFAVGNNMNNIQYYEIKQILQNNFTPNKIEELPNELNGFRAIIYLDDSIIYGAPYQGNMHLFKYNSESKKLEQFIEYPKIFPLLHPEIKREVFGCFMAVKPDNSKFVLAYSIIGKIEIFDLIKDNPISISYKGFPSIEENTGLNSTSQFLVSNPEERIFCEGIVATNKYFYVRVLNDKYSKVYLKNGPKRSFVPEIHVFDWSGNPILKIILENYYSNYNIDVDDHYLYTIDDSVENIIKRYDLTTLLPKQD